MGRGRIIAGREIGGRQQRLVDFAEAGRSIWMPWERLRFVKGAMYRFGHDDVGGKTAAERLRLRNLAHALELWKEKPGALSKFDIDPIHHQITLVHHIHGSGHPNSLLDP